ncbi:uncharacterized protein VP01_83g18 [Puccinia sorghi]|uniref:[histone H3]-lysine(36) N-trimethyltransferase n=1 Tax=Puccinia sorghi TaxID=27349 RepID=A0A0L6UBK6_9BASI|nr:uncharacterized protein VP01_83g18 [Puccinia sorghi]
MTETEEAAGSREERTTVSLATTSRTVLSRTPDSDHTSSPTITPVTPADNMDVCLMAESLHASKGTGSCAKLPRKTKGKERAPKDAVPDHVQLIHHFPQANALASKTFTQIHQNWYQNKSLGITRQPEDAMICDCTWTPGDDPSWACSEHSGCINYLTQIECLQDQCRCHEKCQNQRFQKRLFAPIDIVLTPKKGFGMRLMNDLPKDSFVYEYLGEVIGEKALHKRLKDYAVEGIKHFYFMQLQKDEYIDATKKGGFGRFLNHSCSPNCYIGKWVVGRHLRMGIFTKRAVRAGEELTFDYNVDRYGHEPQECFCGEPNCVGILGGKTQTDLGAMDDLYIDALGIVDDVEKLKLKGSKTKRSKDMDVDYMITTDQAVQKQLMRLHGFSIMSMILTEYLEDQEIVKTWPLITKNKILSTNLEETVMKLSDSPSEVVQTLAAELIKMWVALEVSYRIPKDKKNGEVADGSKRKAEALLDQIFSKRLRDSSVRKNLSGVKVVSEEAFIRPEAAKPLDPQAIKPENLTLPPGWAFERTAEGKPYYYHVAVRQTQWTIPTGADVARMERWIADDLARQKAAALDVEDIVAKAKAEAEELRKANEAQRLLEEAEKARLKSLLAERKDKHRSNHRTSSSSSLHNNHHHHQHHHHRKKIVKDAPTSSSSSSDVKSLPPGSLDKTSHHNQSQMDAVKDKKMLRLFSNVIVHTMSRYKDSLDHEQFKRRAKELTNILCEKERKSSQYSTETYESMSARKETKIQQFTKDWMGKLLMRKGLLVSTGSSSTPPSTDSGAAASSGLPPHPSVLPSHNHPPPTSHSLSPPPPPPSSNRCISP